MNEKERKELIEAFENDLAVDSNRINMSIFIIVCIMLYLWYRGWVASILGIVDDHTGERAVYAITMLPTIYLFTIGMGCYYKLGGPSLMGYIILKTGITGRVSKGYQKGKGSYKLSSGKTYYIEVLKCSNLIRGVGMMIVTSSLVNSKNLLQQANTNTTSPMYAIQRN